MDNSGLRIEFDIRPEDYAAAAQTQSIGRYGRVMLLVVGLLILGVGLSELVITRDLSNLWMIFFGAFLALSRPLLTRLTWKRDKRLARHVVAEFSYTSAIFTTDNGHSEMKWSAFSNFIESDDYFFLYQSRYLCNFIPKRDISPTTLQQFKSLLESKGIQKRKSRSNVIRVLVFWLVIAISGILLWLAVSNGGSR